MVQPLPSWLKVVEAQEKVHSRPPNLCKHESISCHCRMPSFQTPSRFPVLFESTRQSHFNREVVVFILLAPFDQRLWLDISGIIKGSRAVADGNRRSKGIKHLRLSKVYSSSIPPLTTRAGSRRKLVGPGDHWVSKSTV